MRQHFTDSRPPDLMPCISIRGIRVHELWSHYDNDPTHPRLVAVVRCLPVHLPVCALCAAAGSGSAWVAFVAGPCPAGIVPARSWRSGRPASGSWSEVALAVGLGLPVVVFWCAPGSAVLPSWGSSWVPAGRGVWALGWRFVPPASSLL